MNMNRARAAYAAEHMHVNETLDKDGKVVSTQRVRNAGAPSFRQWARERLTRTTDLSPKLARIVRGGR